MLSDQYSHRTYGQEAACVDFRWVDGRRRITLNAVNSDELPARFRTGRNFEMLAQKLWGYFQSKFFLQLADGTGVVLLAATQMARGAGIVTTGERVFRRAALLNKKLARRVEDKNVNRTVFEPAGMDFLA